MDNLVYRHYESYVNKKINSKQKGNSGEREFIQEFKLVSGIELKRNYDQTAFGGHDIIVAKLDSDLAKFIDDRYAIEIKRRKKITPADINVFWEQTVEQAKKIVRYPLLAFRQDYRPWRMLYPLMWYNDKTVDGTAEMSLIGCVNWIRYEMRQYENND